MLILVIVLMMLFEAMNLAPTILLQEGRRKTTP